MFFTLILQIAALSTVAFAGPANRKPPNNIMTDKYTDRDFNSRRILRFSQLWNMFSARNLDLPESERQRLQSIMNRTRVPQMHADMPVDQVTEQIKKDAEELLKALEAEKHKGKNLAVIIANQDYLKNRLLPNLKNPKYFSGSALQYAAEQKFMMPAPEPPSTTQVEESPPLPQSEPSKPLPLTAPALKIYLLPDSAVSQ